MAYVYRHVRLDKNEPFYIGIGSDNKGKYERAFSKFSRSEYWNAITDKTEYQVDILLDELTWEDACKKEIEFIKIYGRKDKNLGCLCNLTDGGEGSLGCSPTKKRVSKMKGMKRPPFSEETKRKMADAKKNFIPWNVGIPHSKETKDKISAIHKGRKNSPLSEETKKKISEANKGKKRPPITEETREKIRQNSCKNRHTEESRRKISESNKGRKGFIGGDNPMALILLDINTGIFYDTAKELADMYKVSYQTLMRHIRGELAVNRYSNIKIV